MLTLEHVHKHKVIVYFILTFLAPCDSTRYTVRKECVVLAIILQDSCEEGPEIDGY